MRHLLCDMMGRGSGRILATGTPDHALLGDPGKVTFSSLCKTGTVSCFSDGNGRMTYYGCSFGPLQLFFSVSLALLSG